MAHKRISAGDRIKKQGKSLVWVTLTEGDKAKVRMAAAASGVPMSQFLIAAGLREANKILKKLPISD